MQNITENSEKNNGAKKVVALLVLESDVGSAELGSDSSVVSTVTATGSRPGFQILEGSTVRIGRAKTNDVVLSDRDVSRFHATLSASASGIVISDLSSTNGTFVNTKRITTPVDLVSGDKVTIGNCKLSLVLHLTEEMEEHDGTTTALADLRSVEVTVLLADVVSYTRMSQMLPGDDLAKMLRIWFDRVGQVIERHGGEIDKYIGDCVMAIWRSGREDAKAAATKAVQAALEIVQATDELGSEDCWSHSPKYPWLCRTALNSGTALFGNVGTTDQRNYTVLGDAVNIAFRVESLAGKLNSKTLAAEATANLVNESFQTEKLGSFVLEGRSEEVGIFSLSEKI